MGRKFWDGVLRVNLGRKCIPPPSLSTLVPSVTRTVAKQYLCNGGRPKQRGHVLMPQINLSEPCPRLPKFAIIRLIFSQNWPPNSRQFAIIQLIFGQNLRTSTHRLDLRRGQALYRVEVALADLEVVLHHLVERRPRERLPLERHIHRVPVVPTM